MSTDHLMWEDLNTRDILETRVFKVREIHRRGPDGRETQFVRVDAPDWVTIVPEILNEGGEPSFLIVRQYRHGSGRLSMEFPAGTVEGGDPADTTARRELLEETGHTAQDWKEIGRVSPNPAFMGNISTTFLARGLKRQGELKLDDHEHLDCHVVSFRELAAAMGAPPYDSAIMIQAWFWYLKHTRRLSGAE